MSGVVRRREQRRGVAREQAHDAQERDDEAPPHGVGFSCAGGRGEDPTAPVVAGGAL